MNPDEYIERVRDLVRKNRPLWYQMDKAGVASYRYLVRFAQGEFESPGIHKLSAIERYIQESSAKKPDAHPGTANGGGLAAEA